MRPRTALWARRLGALALLGAGLEHLDQLTAQHYSAIPTIGTLFALDVAGSAAVATGLLAPVHRLPGRAGRWAVRVLCLAGIAIAAGSVAGLYVSEHGGLFGFREVGTRPAIVWSIVFELLTLLLLAVPLVAGTPLRVRRGQHDAGAWR